MSWGARLTEITKMIHSCQYKTQLRLWLLSYMSKIVPGNLRETIEDTILYQRILSTLVWLMAYSLTAPIHQQNWCWLVINDALQHSPEGNKFQNKCSRLSLLKSIQMFQNQKSHIPGGQWVNKHGHSWQAIFSNVLSWNKILHAWINFTELYFDVSMCLDNGLTQQTTHCLHCLNSTKYLKYKNVVMSYKITTLKNVFPISDILQAYSISSMFIKSDSSYMLYGFIIHNMTILIKQSSNAIIHHFIINYWGRSKMAAIL